MIENEKASIKCWICGNIADSGEHKIKASDLRIIFNSDFFFLNDSTFYNYKCQSIKSNPLKFSKVICKQCNSTTTQPHDRAWEEFSRKIQSIDIGTKDKIRFNKIFPYNTKYLMRHVHLYFVKILGCIIAENKLNINLDKFSQSIKKDKLHPNVYIAFGKKYNDLSNQSAIMSDLDIYSDTNGCAFATFSIFLPHVTVCVMYARTGEARTGLDKSWHPNKNTMCTKIFDTNELIAKK